MATPSLVGPAIVATAFDALATWYGWRRLVRDTELRKPWRTIATVAMVALAASAPATLILRVTHVTTAAGVLAWPAMTWFALWTATVIVLLAIDLGKLVVRAARPKPVRGVDPSRRAVLARIGGAAALGLAAGDVALGMRNALGEHRIVDVPITLAKLPAALDGFTIAQITDLHVGLTIGRGFVQEVVDKVNAMDVDLVAITGDLVDGDVGDYRGDLAPLAGLRSRHGTYFVTGNHEYYSGVEQWLPVYADFGFRILRNERVTIEHDGASFDLAGIDDAMAYHHGHGHKADLPRALAGRDEARVVVLMAHQPKQAREAARMGVDLQLSGHTHGGQIWPWHYLAEWQQGGLLAGHYRLGDTQLYVSRGVGFVGPPIRVGAPAEITRVILRAPR